ncbi:hypothetical protein ACPF7Z_00180 [Halomonas sp. GXIMD04776]|uniref:hypothetical protein n=1 Tax=Halomonas sp. GXIMD04776 TaxID=3415605 RepID=UPI003CC401A8
MPKTLLKDLGVLGIVLGLTLEAPAFAQDPQGDAEEPDQQIPTSMQNDGAEDPASREGMNETQDDTDSDTEGGMVKEDKAGFGSGGEAMPGTDLPKSSEDSSEKPSEQQTDTDE